MPTARSNAALAFTAFVVTRWDKGTGTRWISPGKGGGFRVRKFSAIQFFWYEWTLIVDSGNFAVYVSFPGYDVSIVNPFSRRTCPQSPCPTRMPSTSAGAYPLGAYELSTYEAYSHCQAQFCVSMMFISALSWPAYDETGFVMGMIFP